MGARVHMEVVSGNYVGRILQMLNLQETVASSFSVIKKWKYYR